MRPYVCATGYREGGRGVQRAVPTERGCVWSCCMGGRRVVPFVDSFPAGRRYHYRRRRHRRRRRPTFPCDARRGRAGSGEPDCACVMSIRGACMSVPGARRPRSSAILCGSHPALYPAHSSARSRAIPSVLRLRCAHGTFHARVFGVRTGGARDRTRGDQILSQVGSVRGYGSEMHIGSGVRGKNPAQTTEPPRMNVLR